MELVKTYNQLKFNAEILKRLSDFQVNNFNTITFTSRYPFSIIIFKNEICVAVKFKISMIQLLRKCKFMHYLKPAANSTINDYCTVNVIGETNSSIQHKILLGIIKDELDV